MKKAVGFGSCKKLLTLLITLCFGTSVHCALASTSIDVDSSNTKDSDRTAEQIDKEEDTAADNTPSSKDDISEEDIAWAENTDCTSCHPKEVERMTNEKCLTSVHPDLDCIDCHTEYDLLAPMHEGVTEEDEMPASLYSTSIDTDELCTPCHDSEELVVITEKSTVLTDDNGTTVNPHDLPAIADHQEITCVSCHKMHSTTALEKTSSRACSSCHHAGVYECNTCHAV